MSPVKKKKKKKTGGKKSGTIWLESCARDIVISLLGGEFKIRKWEKREGVAGLL